MKYRKVPYSLTIMYFSERENESFPIKILDKKDYRNICKNKQYRCTNCM